MRALFMLIAFSTVMLAEGPEFDVASVKQSVRPAANTPIMIGPARGGPGTADPTHIVWNMASLKNVVMAAYDVKNYQVTGPDWLEQERVDLAVVVPEGATKEQVALMWRNLLASRFGMKVHIEQKEFNVDELVVGPRGHKLKESDENNPSPIQFPGGPGMPPPPPPPPPPGANEEGKSAQKQPQLMMMISNGPNGIVGKASGRAQPISGLVQMISQQIGHPVVDKTGLTGKYDFDLEFAPTNLRGPGGEAIRAPGQGPAPGAAPAAAAPDLGLDLGEAVQQQLGLRLVKGKGKLDNVVIDKIERTPTDN
ncbi:MAG: TIGR03435 family protein [Acidobacteriota bacterium]